MQKSHRSPVRFLVIGAALLAIGASDTDCEGEAMQPILVSLRELHRAIDDLEDAVCTHYDLSGDYDVAPEFCPDLDPCSEPTDVGPCDAAIPRWTFDAESGECVRFVWGGCEANGNNFVTKDECEGTCDPCEVDCGPAQECVRDGDCAGSVCDFCADTCAGVRCEEGEHCELVDVVCITSPCPPVAQCVPDTDPVDPCAALECDEGYRCSRLIGVVVQCFSERPCPVAVACIPEDDPCDEPVCADDEICVHAYNRCRVNETACDAYGEAECIPREPCPDGCGEGQTCLLWYELGSLEDEHNRRGGRCSGEGSP